jgi:predicted chitinase
MDLSYPLSKKGPITSGFDYRTHPVLGKRIHHNGVDIGVPDNTEVYSIADGTVVRSDMENISGYGNFIIIDHGGFLSAYAHLMNRQVNVGDKVKKGEKIALSGGGQGKSKGGGMSTGPHLHFEIRKTKNAKNKSEFENPMSYLSGTLPLKGGKNKETNSSETKTLVKKLKPKGYSGKSLENINILIKQMESKGITDPIAQLGILSTIGKESGFIPQNEVGYGGTPNSSIRSIFGKKVSRLSNDQLSKLKSSDEDFFNYVYGRKMSPTLGNTEPGDGYRYRGRGFNQITGKGNYRAYGYESNPDALNSVEGAGEAAIKFLTNGGGSSLNNKFKTIEDSIRHFVTINAGGRFSQRAYRKAKDVANKFNFELGDKEDSKVIDIPSDDISIDDLGLNSQKGFELLRRLTNFGNIGKTMNEEVDRIKDIMKKII